MLGYSTSVDIIYKVARQLNASLDLDEVLGTVLRLTVEATAAERASFFLIEAGIVVRQILSRPNQSPEVSQRNVKLAMSHGLAGWVFRHKHGALAANAITDERWIQLPDDTEVTGSAIVVPLLYQGQVNGVLALHHRQVCFFDEGHLAIAAGIAGQAAIAVENARLFTQVRDERENLYALINAMPIPVLEIDSDDRITFANQKARQSLLIKEDNIQLHDVEGGRQLKLALEETQNQPGSHIEVRWSDDRVFNVSVNDVPHLGAVVTLDDITYLKELDAMKSQFVETVSHDLKNPLTVIEGLAQLMGLESDISPESKESIPIILESAQQMQALIDDLLDLAQIEAGMGGQAESCDMLQIVKNVLANYRPQAKDKNQILSTTFSPKLPAVLGNPIRLSQVVSNLVSNAIKYTPAGGNIDIKLSQHGSEIWLDVSDTGPGIAPVGLSQLFQKFYRVPEIAVAQQDVGGTGLGLSIVKAIVEEYGGRVWVESKVGVGSTFGCALLSWSPQAEMIPV